MNFNCKWMCICALLSIGFIDSLIVRENVVFNKISERSSSRSTWTITLLLNLSPYRNILDGALKNLTSVAHANMKIIREKIINIDPTFKLHFDDLNEQLAHLNQTRNDKMDIFNDYNSMGNRIKRSLIPFVGDALSYLFGTVSGADLDGIRKAVNALNTNQEKIQHVINSSLSIINMSHNKIVENRNRINQLNKGLSEIFYRLNKETNTINAELNQLRAALSYYLQLNSLVDSAKQLMYESLVFIEDFQIQINVLSTGRISPNIILPSKLLEILLEIKARLPEDLKLPFRPANRLWDFYKILTCSTVFENDRVMILIRVPLITIGNKLNVYRIHNMPLSNIKTFNTNWISNDKHMIAQYDLEATALAINKKRTKYMLLTEEETRNCAENPESYCEFKSPLYPINQSKYCVTALIMNDKEKIKQRCTITVKPNEVLPQAKNVAKGIWAISTNKPLRFAITCENKETTTIVIEPPLDILRQPIGCTCDSDYLSFQAHYEFHSSMVELEPHVNRIKNKFKGYNFTLWEPFTNSLKTYNKTWSVEDLEDIKDTKMKELIKKLGSISHVDLLKKRQLPPWKLTLIIIRVLSVTFIVLYVVVFRRQNLFSCLTLDKQYKIIVYFLIF